MYCCYTWTLAFDRSGRQTKAMSVLRAELAAKGSQHFARGNPKHPWNKRAS